MPLPEDPQAFRRVRQTAMSAITAHSTAGHAASLRARRLKRLRILALTAGICDELARAELPRNRGRPGGRFGMYFRTVRGETLSPSLSSSSLAMRSSPQSAFSAAMRRIS